MPSYLPMFHSETPLDLLAIKNTIEKKGKGWAVLRGLVPFLMYHFHSYPHYLSNQNHFPQLKRHSSAGKLLHSLYDRKSKAFAYIRESRERGRKTLGCCPYCGLPGNVTLDHYLPRDVKLFPHYAALKVNLVPACFDCQLKKSNFSPSVSAKTRLAAKRVEKQGAHGRHAPIGSFVAPRGNSTKLLAKTARMRKRGYPTNFHQLSNRIIHPYYDAFLQNPVIFFSTNWHGEAGYKINVRNCTTRERSLLEFHIRAIGLAQRAEAPIRHFKAAILKHFKRTGIHTPTSALAALPGLLEDAIERGGGVKNYLEAVTIRSLSSDAPELARIVELSQVRDFRLKRVSLGRRN